MNTFYTQRGISLIELLIGILLLSLMLSMAVPAWQHTLGRYQHQRTLHRLAQLIITARSLSLLHQTTVTLCPSTTPPTCIAQWQAPLIIKDTHDHILLHTPGLDSGESLTLSAFPSNRYLQFNAVGLLKNSNGTFTYCHGDHTPQDNQLVVSRSGRVRYQSGTTPCKNNKA